MIMKNLNEYGVAEMNEVEMTKVDGGICINLIIWNSCYSKGRRWIWQQL